MQAESFRQLHVWQRSMSLVVNLYTIARQFPAEEKFGLTSQVRRAAVSVPANIAEGNARRSKRDYANFLAIARGSLAELETLLILAVQLEFIKEAAVQETISEMEEISRMLNALRSRLIE